MPTSHTVATPPDLPEMPPAGVLAVQRKLLEMDSGDHEYDRPPEEIIQDTFGGNRNWYLWAVASMHGIVIDGRPVTRIPWPTA